MTSKLTRFKSGLPLARAAQWLESLIGEAASADDLFDLYLDGHLNISIGGPFTGMPMEEPYPGKKVWTGLGKVSRRVHAVISRTGAV